MKRKSANPYFGRYSKRKAKTTMESLLLTMGNQHKPMKFKKQSGKSSGNIKDEYWITSKVINKRPATDILNKLSGIYNLY